MGDGILTEQQARKNYGDAFKKDWEDVRHDTEDPKKGNPFGGARGKKAKLDGSSPGQEKHVGQGGFGARLIGASAEAAHDHAGEWGQLATPVRPVNDVLDRALEAQRSSVERNTNSDYYDGDPSWLVREKAYSRAWATENMATIERHKFEQWRWCGAYNAWGPLANSSHGAMAELVESAGLMGFDTSKGKDSAAFVEGLEMSLDMAIKLVDAKVLDEGKHSWSTRGDSNKATATSRAKPQLGGEQMTPKLDGVRHAYNKVQVAHHGIYLGLLNDRTAALSAEKGKYTAEVGQITALIEFWSGMGAFVAGNAQTAKKIATGKVGAGIDKRFGNNGDRHAKKELNAAKNTADLGTQHEHVDAYENHHDSWGKGGEPILKKMEEEGEYTPNKVEPAEIPDFSVGGAIKTGLTLMYGAKLDELQSRIEGVERQLEATGRAITLVQTRQAQERFKGAVQNLESEMKKLEAQSMRDREQDMVNFGRDLDAYAVEHRGELEKLRAVDLIPGANGEVYGTAMACVAKVEKYRQLSKLALATFPFNEFNQSITHLGRERIGSERPPESASRSRQHGYRPPPALPSMSPEEQAVFQQIAGSYLLLLQLDTRWGIRLEGVSSKFRTLMRKVSGTNSKNAVGKQF